MPSYYAYTWLVAKVWLHRPSSLVDRSRADKLCCFMGLVWCFITYAVANTLKSIQNSSLGYCYAELCLLLVAAFDCPRACMLYLTSAQAS